MDTPESDRQSSPAQSGTSDTRYAQANQELAQLDAAGAFDVYESVRARLPAATFPAHSTHLANLGELGDACDVFVFDAYGVLNVGSDPIAGARERLDALQARGKTVLILTNGASLPVERNVEKFSALGYDVNQEMIFSSRLAAEQALLSADRSWHWGVAALANFSVDDLPVSCRRLADDAADYAAADAFLLLSTGDWNRQRQGLLVDALKQRARPVVIANPDVVAPFATGFSIEPGYLGHQLADQLGVIVEFHGKPFQSVFELVKQHLASKYGDVPAARICMIGDSLHTDILGGAAAGWRTVLVTDHGLFRGQDVQSYIDRCGIVPDWIIPSI